MSPRALLLCVAVALPFTASARVGGGQSYSGSRSSTSSSRPSSSSHSGSSSSSSWGQRNSSTAYYGTSSGGSIELTGWNLVWVFLLVGVCLVSVGSGFLKEFRKKAVYEPTSEDAGSTAPTRSSSPSVADRLRAVDPSFSEPVFLEWATLLYVRAQTARGGDTEALEPWFTTPAEQLGPKLGTFTITKVRGVVVGSQKLLAPERHEGFDTLGVQFQACLTATVGQKEQSLYLSDRWLFRRKRGVASRTPETVEREGCPLCGSPYERSSLGRCQSCNASLAPGASDWGVYSTTIQRLETRPPLLEGAVEELGTDLPTVFDEGLETGLAALEQAGFDRARFLERANTIFFALQAGWTNQAWDTLRPYETESVFQSHRFWMEEYKKQGLKNVLTGVKLRELELVKATTDAAYEALTCRMHASMRDSTVSVKTGTIVGGNPKADRDFTEYWTFLRRPGAKGAQDDAQCPNCGAPLKVTQAGICEYCQASITRGQFDWVLSRIEQDEDYEG